MALPALGGCIIQGTESTDFPPGLEPVEENSAPAPAAGAGAKYPEEAVVLTGTGDLDGQDYIWVHMRGYLHAPAAEVWRYLQDPDVVADLRHTTRHTVTYDIEPDYDLSYQIHYVEERLLTVEWDENWRYGALDGDFSDPISGAVRFKKVYGTDFIDFIDGSLSLRYIEDGVTEIGFVEHVSALQESEEVSRDYAQDVYDRVLALTNGEPLPET